MKETSNPIYCSLDIETSDFDPAKGEVLEIGMVFFEVADHKINLIKEWQSVFKPAREVPARILALTNISMEELEAARNFSDVRDEVQELVRGCIIVGHNINFDTKFLEGFGIEFSGKSIDTLDLAQIFLPTNPSYNLEALMNHLDVDHKDAHRALADARATLVVIEKLFGIYSALPEQTRSELLTLLSGEFCPEIHDLLKHTLSAPEPVLKKQQQIEIDESREISKKIKGKKEIITVPLGFDYHSYVYGYAAKSKEKILLVVPTKKIVYQLWRQNVAEPILENQEIFDGNKYQTSILDPNLSREQRMFLAKISVWQARNWQRKFLYDLNLTVSGNQHKNLILADGAAQQDSSPRVLCADYLDFIDLNLASKYSNYKVVILDINNFEQALTYASSCKVSWQDFIYSLKQLYDPVSGYGKKEFGDQVADALAATDLFFGLASMNFSKMNSAGNYALLVSDTIRQNENYGAVESSAQNFLAKLQNYNEIFKSERLARNLKNFAEFFRNDPEQVRWVEISEGRLSLMSSPIDLAKAAHSKLDAFKKIVFTASLGSESLIKYFVRRLDLHDFTISSVGQQELRRKVTVEIIKQTADQELIMKILEESEFPAAVLMPNSLGLKKFYEANFATLQKRGRVWAQGYSGGANKIFENFTINPESLLLATDSFINRQIARKVKVKTLVLTRLPFEQFTHPLFAAQAEKYQNQFIDFNIPRALYNFHSLIRFFYSEDLEKIYLVDPKIAKEYGKFFLDYLSSLPFVEIHS